ncbi:hypothetical protein C8R45DRAFT_936024 [Mycena sanguinolenta]|nr:hypothetical protein C8R45DRAFT_936024 [Mycena sanguinolenta]
MALALHPTGCAARQLGSPASAHIREQSPSMLGSMRRGQETRIEERYPGGVGQRRKSGAWHTRIILLALSAASKARTDVWRGETQVVGAPNVSEAYARLAVGAVDERRHFGLRGWIKMRAWRPRACETGTGVWKKASLLLPIALPSPILPSYQPTTSTRLQRPGSSCSLPFSCDRSELRRDGARHPRSDNAELQLVPHFRVHDTEAAQALRKRTVEAEKRCREPRPSVSHGRIPRRRARSFVLKLEVDHIRCTTFSIKVGYLMAHAVQMRQRPHYEKASKKGADEGSEKRETGNDEREHENGSGGEEGHSPNNSNAPRSPPNELASLRPPRRPCAVDKECAEPGWRCTLLGEGRRNPRTPPRSELHVPFRSASAFPSAFPSPVQRHQPNVINTARGISPLRPGQSLVRKMERNRNMSEMEYCSRTGRHDGGEGEDGQPASGAGGPP